MNIQLISLRGRDETAFLEALKAAGRCRKFVVDCNGLMGFGCDAEDLDHVLDALRKSGYHRAGSEKGSPEGVTTVFIR